MAKKLRWTWVAWLVWSCSAEPDDRNLDPPVERGDWLIAGAPDNGSLPMEGKVDAVYPARFDLLAWQTPVRDQGRRGTCSYFVTTAIAEYLYRKNGRIDGPNFSEQYLVWLAKGKLGHNADSEGGNITLNAESLFSYGTVAESIWEYEPNVWTERDDPACGGSQVPVPTRCLTHGSPPPAASSAETFRTSTSRWLRAERRSIKHVLHAEEQVVALSLPVHCQAWNFFDCPFDTDRRLFDRGVITMPNQDDIEHWENLGPSRASHAMVIVGWDDNFQVPRRGRDGRRVRDENGRVLMDRGFFIVKNSWGIRSFGRRSSIAPGYGLVSMDYVERFGHTQTIGLPPESAPESEFCYDGLDNDGDGTISCEDSDCRDSAVCELGSSRWESSSSLFVPDRGMADANIAVQEEGLIIQAALEVKVEEHPGIGDLEFVLHSPDGTQGRLAMQAQPAPTVIRRYLSGFVGLEANGEWRLEARDTREGHEGAIASWTLYLVMCRVGECELIPRHYYEGASDVAIPDGGEVDLRIENVADFEIDVMNVVTDIEHPERGELKVSIVRVNEEGEEDVTVIYNGENGGSSDLVRRFWLMNAQLHTAEGSWTLRVQDRIANGQTGRVRSWGLDFEACGPAGCLVHPQSLGEEVDEWDDGPDAVLEVPDGDPKGRTYEQTLDMDGTIADAAMSLYLNTENGSTGELSLHVEKLDDEGGVIAQADVFLSDGIQREFYLGRLFDVDALDGLPMRGRYRMRIVDHQSGNPCSLEDWALYLRPALEP